MKILANQGNRESGDQAPRPCQSADASASWEEPDEGNHLGPLSEILKLDPHVRKLEFWLPGH